MAIIKHSTGYSLTSLRRDRVPFRTAKELSVDSKVLSDEELAAVAVALEIFLPKSKERAVLPGYLTSAKYKD